MNKFAAERFYNIGRLLRAIATLVETEELNENDKKIIGGFLDHIDADCTSVGLKVTRHAIKDARGSIASAKDKSDNPTCVKKLATIESIIQWEMQETVFMHIPSERAARYDLTNAFGDTVSKHFPSSAFDIKEAGNCFASGRFTACVFHLMRALEISLISFAKLFPSVPTDKENWQQIIEKIESEIREMPKAPVKAADWKEKQEKYSQLATNFMFFKDAWRNYTAHARGKYTEDEADAIYRNVRAFIHGLAAQSISE